MLDVGAAVAEEAAGGVPHGGVQGQYPDAGGCPGESCSGLPVRSSSGCGLRSLTRVAVLSCELLLFVAETEHLGAHYRTCGQSHQGWGGRHRIRCCGHRWAHAAHQKLQQEPQGEDFHHGGRDWVPQRGQVKVRSVGPAWAGFPFGVRFVRGVYAVPHAQPTQYAIGRCPLCVSFGSGTHTHAWAVSSIR
jgi:hypothetical protein